MDFYSVLVFFSLIFSLGSHCLLLKFIKRVCEKLVKVQIFFSSIYSIKGTSIWYFFRCNLPIHLPKYRWRLTNVSSEFIQYVKNIQRVHKVWTCFDFSWNILKYEEYATIQCDFLFESSTFSLNSIVLLLPSLKLWRIFIFLMERA